MNLPTLAELDAAAEMVRSVVPPTPQYRWPLLCARIGCEVWVKHENHTPIGAFKVRGGLVYTADLVRYGVHRTKVVAATRGNHGQSVGFAARRYGLKAVIVVPKGNSREKSAAICALGAELVEHGHDFQAAFEYAQGLTAERGFHLFPSFHPLLVRGVGTYAVEFLRAVPDLDEIYVPIGLGSGICGVAAAREALGLKTAIVGVVSERAPAYALSFAKRRLISHEVTTTIADGLACRRPDEAALDVIWRYVDRIVRVSDAEVQAAMRALFTDTHNVAEGAGAVGLAGLLQSKTEERGSKVGIVLSGSNVDRDVFARVLRAAGMNEDDR